MMYDRHEFHTRTAIRSFFDADLKRDVQAPARLRGDRQYEEVGLVYEE
jgi:hypothetical protein